MYSSGYSQVSKTSPQAQKKMQYRSKGKSCGYYMRIVFLFSSLIQSLIIVSLVLFLVYGKTQDSASTSRIQDLEESFSRLSIENVVLRQQRKNLTNLLNATLIEKARNDWDLARHRSMANISAFLILNIDKKQQQCNNDLLHCKAAGQFNSQLQNTYQLADNCNCGPHIDQLRARLELMKSNFTQTSQMMRREMDQIVKERDNINLEVIRLRRDKSTHEKEVDFFKQKCKDDFTQSLSGISNVSHAFLGKIESLFPSHIAFQLTCPKQREHLEQIRTNCTSLSMEVEDRFQSYLNSVGDQVSSIQAESSRLKAENWRLSNDYRGCTTNRTGLIHQQRKNLDKLQQKHDEDKEILLMDKMRLNGEIEVLTNNVKYKSKVIDHLTEQNRQLNMSCTSKTAYGGFAGSSISRTGTFSVGDQLSRVGSGGLDSNVGSYGSSINRQASTGVGSSLSAGSGSSFGLGINRQASTGVGSSLSAGSGSSFGLGINKPGSTGVGSSLSTGSGSSFGLGINKPGSTGVGSSLSTGSGSSFGLGINKPGSTGGAITNGGVASNKPVVTSGRGSSNYPASSGSSGTGSNKPTSNVKSSPATGSSSGSSSVSTGSTSKSGSFSWFGSSKMGSGTGKAPSTGNSNSGTGTSYGGGKTSGLGGGSISVAQHLMDLQRIINPPGTDEKQDLSRMLG